MPTFPSEIDYGDYYQDDVYEYKNIALPRDLFERKPKGLLSEDQWRQLGIKQTQGWEHWACFRPEPHVLMFRRPLGYDKETNIIPNHVREQMRLYSQKKAQYFSKA